MARTQTSETPPLRALRAVPDSAPKKAPKKAASPRPASRPAASPKAVAPSGSPVLLAFSKYQAKTPPAKRAIANAELVAAIDARLRGLIAELAEIPGPYFAFCVAALSEAVSQAYAAAGTESAATLSARYESTLATAMRPTSRRAWAAFHLHADEAGLRPLVRGIVSQVSNEDVARDLSALNQALCDVYAKSEKSAE